MATGDHLRVPGDVAPYHHGIDTGEGTVVHFWGTKKDSAIIREDHLTTFAQGKPVQKLLYERRYHGPQAVERARSLIKKPIPYSLIQRNCEHFAFWCTTGESKSYQVQGAVTLAIAAGVLIAAGQDSDHESRPRTKKQRSARARR